MLQNSRCSSLILIMKLLSYSVKILRGDLIIYSLQNEICIPSIFMVALHFLVI